MQSHHHIIDVFQARAFLRSEWKWEIVETQYRRQEKDRPGLLQRHLLTSSRSLTVVGGRQFIPEYHYDIDQQDDVDQDDRNNRDSKEQVTFPNINPAVVVFKKQAINYVRDGDEKRDNPTKDLQVMHCFLLDTQLGQNEFEEDSFAEHAEIGGKGDVGSDGMDDPTPYAVPGPNIDIIENKVKPNNPREAVQPECDQEILMNGGFTAVKTIKEIEDEKRNCEKDERDEESN